MNVCENPDILRVIWFFMIILDIVKIIIPIALIVLGIIDFSKAVIVSDENAQKKSGKLFVKRLMYAILIFIIPWIVEVLIITLGDLAVLDSDDVNFTDCLDNANGEKIEELEQKIEDDENNLYCWQCIDNNNLYYWGTSLGGNNSNCHAGWYKVDSREQNCGVKSCYLCTATNERYWGTSKKQSGKYCPTGWVTTNETETQCNKSINDELNNKENKTLIDSADNDGQTDGLFIGTKYNLTDRQLREIARLCQQEQGTAKGAAAEASLMANRFELFGSKYGTGADGLYNYVANSGWFANAKEHMSKTSSLKNEIYTAVYEVLVLGKRTLPYYIDEHDCIDCEKYGFDVVKIITGGTIVTDKDGLKNHNNYVQDETIIYNKHDSIYTFYTFPTKNSDPFGYTSSAKNKYDKLMNK